LCSHHTLKRGLLPLPLRASPANPEAAGDIRFSLILGLALIESLVIYVLVAFFVVQGKLPGVEQVLELAKAAIK